MKKVIIAFMILSVSCTKTKETTNSLISMGYDSVETTGYKFFGCDEKDLFHTGFIAYKNGKKIKGVGCAGWFKGTTIRFK